MQELELISSDKNVKFTISNLILDFNLIIFHYTHQQGVVYIFKV